MGYKVADLAAQIFGLSRQQLYRLESLTELPPPLQLAVAHGTLPTTHAVVLHQALMRLGPEIIDLDSWVSRIGEETMSVRGLGAALGELVPVRQHGAFVAELDGDAISFRSKRIDVAGLSDTERHVLIGELEEALRALRRMSNNSMA